MNVSRQRGHETLSGFDVAIAVETKMKYNSYIYIRIITFIMTIIQMSTTTITIKTTSTSATTTIAAIYATIH